MCGQEIHAYDDFLNDGGVRGKGGGNAERFIAFQNCASATRRAAPCVRCTRSLDNGLGIPPDAWETGQHQILVEETARTCKRYLSAYRHDESEEHRTQALHSLVLLGKLRTDMHWIT